ncbi:non-muscle cofilin 1-like [Parambassis ranga]|uniref:Non-muscle cofilin 1-like n=1 Tax=Parambassis ranga TaxID=210632 RepID=A0A6P7JQ69_9TELE|nr:cofilin-2-like [Parambassis ranga]
MASGVQVSDEVKDIINEMRVVKADSDQKERIRLVAFQIADGFIQVKEIFREKDLSGVDDVFKFFLSKLKAEQCCYLLYDCHFETKESGRKEELVFVLWGPENAPIKQKMVYASSKDALKKVLSGIKHELQMNDLSDYGTRENFAERVGKGVIKVEGHSCNS